MPRIAPSSLALLLLAASGTAQGSGWQQIGQLTPYGYAVPPVPNASGLTLLVAEHFVRFPQASYLRLELADVRLGEGSWIEVQSLRDGEVEPLSAAVLARQRNISSFFNGEAVRVRLWAAPHTAANGFRIKEVAVGFPRLSQPLTLCKTDDRVLSNDKRVARMVMNGTYCKCTAFLIDSRNCFATAGHCFGNFNILSLAVEFNVPLSDSNGNCQHPPVSDQYKWMGSQNTKWTDDGLGNDWGVFITEKNSVTDKHAGEVQGTWFRFTQVPPDNSTVRVTGHGTDSTPDNTRERVQQTDAGPLLSFEGTTLRYRVDSTDGNSGSPVIDELTDRAIAIHTTGGCKPDSDSNKGTWIWHPDFLAAGAELCPRPDFGTFDDLTLPPPCKGSGSGDCATLAAVGNGDGLPSEQLAVRGTGGEEFLIRATLAKPTRICALDLLTKAAATGTITIGLYLADATGLPQSRPVRTGTMAVGPTGTWTRSSFTPVDLAAGAFFVAFQNPTPSLTLSAIELGTLGTHYERSPAGLRGPFTTVPWAYRVLAGEPGPNAAPRLGHHGVPTAGSSFRVLLSQARPGAVAILVQGFSNRSWGPLPLPFPLKDFGAPQCSLGASMDIVFGTATGRDGTAAIPLAMPSIPGIGGNHLYYQWIVFDAPANPVGLAFSGVGDGRIGN